MRKNSNAANSTRVQHNKHEPVTWCKCNVHEHYHHNTIIILTLLKKKLCILPSSAQYPIGCRGSQKYSILVSRNFLNSVIRTWNQMLCKEHYIACSSIKSSNSGEGGLWRLISKTHTQLIPHLTQQCLMSMRVDYLKCERKG